LSFRQTCCHIVQRSEVRPFGRARTFNGVPLGSFTMQVCAQALVASVASEKASKRRFIRLLHACLRSRVAAEKNRIVADLLKKL
ncbi:MAG: hypothetical protein P8Y53_03815, partial [Pseudolabrys sp.]